MRPPLTIKSKDHTCVWKREMEWTMNELRLTTPPIKQIKTLEQLHSELETLIGRTSRALKDYEIEDIMQKVLKGYQR